MENSFENTIDPVDKRPLLVLGDNPTFHTVTEMVASKANRKVGPGWY